MLSASIFYGSHTSVHEYAFSYALNYCSFFPSCFCTHTQGFVKAIVDVTAIRSAMRRDLSIDVDHMPLGSLTRKQVRETKIHFFILPGIVSLCVSLTPKNVRENEKIHFFSWNRFIMCYPMFVLKCLCMSRASWRAHSQAGERK